MGGFAYLDFVPGGTLRKGRLALVPKVSRPLRKPPPENRKEATGELFRPYRKIGLVLQGNPLAPTGESLGGYREICWGIQEGDYCIESCW